MLHKLKICGSIFVTFVIPLTTNVIVVLPRILKYDVEAGICVAYIRYFFINLQQGGCLCL